MTSLLFDTLATIDDYYWSYIGFSLIIFYGSYLSYKSQFFQFKVLFTPKSALKDLHQSVQNQERGTNPFKLFFASVGGMIGLGNMVAVISALLIGGPGALFWLWIAAFIGMVIKYSEIYLGITYRVKNDQGGYDGGPMYYLQQAYKSAYLNKIIPVAAAVLLCIYGVEIYQFVVVVDTITELTSFDRLFVVIAMLIGTMIVGFGGVRRLSNICSTLMPAFIVIYIFMCSWVLTQYMQVLPEVLLEVVRSAFQGSAPLGGFVGSTMLLAAQQGLARAVYSGDIGIGYDSIIQSDTKSNAPQKQSKMAIYGVFIDLIFSTMGMLVVLVTGLLWDAEGLLASQYVPRALSYSFPYVEYFMGVFIFLAGWTTTTGYLVVGARAARFISPKYGYGVFMLYAFTAFTSFSYLSQEKVLLIMSISGGLLMMINISGIYKLRHVIKFNS